MEERKPVSVFKSICWGVFIFGLSYGIIILLGIIYGSILGWLLAKSDFIFNLMSHKAVSFIVLTMLAAGAGRITFWIVSLALTVPFSRSESVGKGFLGAGIVLIVLCIIQIVISFMGDKVLALDVSAGLCGFWYVMLGLVSEDDKNGT